MHSRLLTIRPRIFRHRAIRFSGWLAGMVAAAATAWGVNPGEPSMTAEGVTVYRAIAALSPDERVRNPDHLAHKLIGSEYWRNSPYSLNYEKSKRFIDKYKISIYYYVNARTKHIDKILAEAARDGLRQVVNLGAGYDSRAYRFADKMPDAVFFELDLPATIDAKRKRLLTFMETIPDRVKLLSIDFNIQTLEQVLLAAGYDPELKTLFIWEGVTYYISPAAVSGTLAFITARSPPGSSVVFDYMPAAVVRKAYRNYPDARGPAARVARLGEPWVFGISEGRAECYVNSQGLRVLSILYPREMESRYLYRSDGNLDGRAPSYFRIMHAAVVQPDARQSLVAKGCEPSAANPPLPAARRKKKIPPAVPAEIKEAGQSAFTSLTGTWTGTDTLGGKLVFGFFADDTCTARRTGGRDASLKNGVYNRDGTVVKAKTEDIAFTAVIAGNTLKGSWTQASTAVSADFTLTKKAAPRSAGETAAVNRVLRAWVRYWNAGNVDEIMTLVHAEARMMYGGPRQKMATYAEYPGILPGRMAVVGDCVLTQPDIQVSGDTAAVNARQDTPIGSIPVTFLLKKENTGWKIIRFEYEL